MKQMTLRRLKGVGLSVLTAAALCLVLPKLSADAQATDAGKCGKYYTYAAQGGLFVQRTASGAATEIVKPSKYYSVDSCVMDNTTIYYATMNASRSKVCVYRIKPDGTSKKKLVELSGQNTVLQGISGNSLVYTYESSKDPERVHTRRYSLTNKRTYKVRNNFSGKQFLGKQVIGTSEDDRVAPGDLYTVGGETGSWFRISRSCLDYQVIGKKIYYIECTNKDIGRNRITAVKSCDRNGDNIKTLATNIKNVDIDEMVPTDKGVYYTCTAERRVYGYEYKSQSKKVMIDNLSDGNYVLDYMSGKILVQDPTQTEDPTFTNTIYTIVPGKSGSVKEAELESEFIFFVSGKTYYAEHTQTDVVRLGRLSR